VAQAVPVIKGQEGISFEDVALIIGKKAFIFNIQKSLKLKSLEKCKRFARNDHMSNYSIFS
jgi:hypothetical protein